MLPIIGGMAVHDNVVLLYVVLVNFKSVGADGTGKRDEKIRRFFGVLTLW